MASRARGSVAASSSPATSRVATKRPVEAPSPPGPLSHGMGEGERRRGWVPRIRAWRRSSKRPPVPSMGSRKYSLATMGGVAAVAGDLGFEELGIGGVFGGDLVGFHHKHALDAVAGLLGF